MTEKILIVDDEPGLRQMLGFALTGAGFACSEVADAEKAEMAIARETPDLVLLDWMLPGVSGVDLARRLKRDPRTRVLPIIMLTARGEEGDKVRALEVGADDYVTKPFSMAELISRVRAILRRRQLDRLSGDPVRRVGGLRLDLVRHEVRVDDQNVRLTPSEFRLLTFLAEEPERVYSRREIMQHLWQSEYVGDERATDMHVSNLRRKIERDPDNPERVVTVRGIGYKLVPA